MNYSYLFFDLDGTLTESGEGIVNSAVYAFKKMGLTIPDRSELYSFVGPPLSESFTRFGIAPENIDHSIKTFREYFLEYGWKENRPYPGILEVVRDLKAAGYKLAITTTKLESMAYRVMDYFELSPYFDSIVGCLETPDSNRHNKAEVIAHTLNIHNISDTSKVIMIGDRHYDVEGAAANNIRTLGVEYGYGTRDELMGAGALATVSDVEALRHFFLS